MSGGRYEGHRPQEPCVFQCLSCRGAILACAMGANSQASTWRSLSDIQAAMPKAKALGGDRVRFEICGNAYRLIVAFDFGRQIALTKFIGSHAEYDRIDAVTVSQF